MKASGILGTVHCHVCPLKDVCMYSRQDDTYRLAHSGSRDHDYDWGKIRWATQNCPLLKLLEKEMG